MNEFFKLSIAFLSIVGFYYLSATLVRRFSKKYNLRSRGTYIYIPFDDRELLNIVPFDELVERERIIVIIRSEREREDVINDLVERFGTIYKYSFI